MRWIIFACFAAPAFADAPEILDATATRAGDLWRVSVTLRHDDTGWDDYADAWRIVTEDGEIMGERILLHPHVEEQPFTRSLGGVALPPGRAYFIEARSLGEDYGTTRFPLPLD